MIITRTHLDRLFPEMRFVLRDAFLAQYQALFVKYGMNVHPRCVTYFLSQSAHESQGFSRLEESLFYRAERMMEVWPKRFPTYAEAAPYARNPQALANHVYCNRMGNGPESSGDGWHYRGRGYIQLTGKDAYQQVGAITGLPLVANPDLVTHQDYVLECALGFWKWKNLNPLCISDMFTEVTKRVHGDASDIKSRLLWLKKVRHELNV